MRAFATTGCADPLVTMTTVDEPIGAAGEAVVAVEAYSLNRGELIRLARQGAGGRPGQDVAGRVVVAAADGSGPPVGTRVIGHVLGGSWAELVAVPTSSLASLPDEIPIEAAATLPMAGLTALRLLRATATELVGGRVLLAGAGGGVGHAFLELAARLGGELVAVSRHSDSTLKSRGAASVVARVEDAEGPFDLILETLGGPAFASSWQLISPTGTIVWAGQASGEPAPLDFFSRVGPGINPTIKRFSYWPAAEPDAKDLRTLVSLTAAGHLDPAIGATAPWTTTPEALARFAEGPFTGNMVLRVG